MAASILDLLNVPRAARNFRVCKTAAYFTSNGWR